MYHKIETSKIDNCTLTTIQHGGLSQSPMSTPVRSRQPMSNFTDIWNWSVSTFNSFRVFVPTIFTFTIYIENPTALIFCHFSEVKMRWWNNVTFIFATILITYFKQTKNINIFYTANIHWASFFVAYLVPIFPSLKVYLLFAKCQWLDIQNT